MPDEMDEIIGEFITEAEESLDRIDPLFVNLETEGYNRDVLNEIFRSMHTIKGAAGFLGLQSIVDVAHNAENILKRLRDGEVALTRPLVDVILKGVDMLRLLIRHLRLKDGIEEDTSPLVKELNDAIKTSQEIEERSVVNRPDEGVTGSIEIDRGAAVEGEGVYGTAGATMDVATSRNQVEPGGDRIDRGEVIQTLRVDINRIDKVMDLTGEVVLVRNRLLNIADYLEARYPDDPYVESLFETVSFLDLVTSDMQLAVMKIRMQPIKKVFSKFPRLVRDISASLGKAVDLKISGEDTEVDKSVIESIGDPMVHIIRNAIDHGLEPPEERRAKGKPERGTISIDAYQKGNQIVIEISDDGRGIDVERVKRKAVERAIITEDEARRMTDDGAINLIFLPGFSTADSATELSGRGVGMDVVKTNISKLNGYVEVNTKRDGGTVFRISIPLTLAIIHALMVRGGGSQYAIPLAPVEEIVRVSRGDITDVMGQRVVLIRGRVHPLFELSDILGNGHSTESGFRYALVVSIGERRFCIAVDELLGQEEVVIKTIEGIDADSTYIIGATITGDGKVVLILDLAAISRNALGLVKI